MSRKTKSQSDQVFTVTGEGRERKFFSQERLQSPICDGWFSGWSSNTSFRARMVGKCGSPVRLFLCKSDDGTSLAVVRLSGP